MQKAPRAPSAGSVREVPNPPYDPAVAYASAFPRRSLRKKRQSSNSSQKHRSLPAEPSRRRSKRVIKGNGLTIQRKSLHAPLPPILPAPERKRPSSTTLAEICDTNINDRKLLPRIEKRDSGVANPAFRISDCDARGDVMGNEKENSPREDAGTLRLPVPLVHQNSDLKVPTPGSLWFGSRQNSAQSLTSMAESEGYIPSSPLLRQGSSSSCYSSASNRTDSTTFTGITLSSTFSATSAASNPSMMGEREKAKLKKQLSELEKKLSKKDALFDMTKRHLEDQISELKDRHSHDLKTLYKKSWLLSQLLMRRPTKGGDGDLAGPNLQKRLDFYRQESTEINTGEGEPATGPTGRVAMVFTDVKDSTKLWEKDEEQMIRSLRIHNEFIRSLLKQYDGYEVKTEGDGFFCAFDRTVHAIQFALDVQHKLVECTSWPSLAMNEEYDPSGKLVYRGLRVRIGIHVGEPICQADCLTGRMDYFGPPVNLSARIAGAANAGQILVSEVVHDTTVSEIAKLQCRVKDWGFHQLKGIASSERIYELSNEALPERSFPTIRTLGVIGETVNLPSISLGVPVPELKRSNSVTSSTSTATENAQVRSVIHLDAYTDSCYSPFQMSPSVQTSVKAEKSYESLLSCCQKFAKAASSASDDFSSEDWKSMTSLFLRDIARLDNTFDTSTSPDDSVSVPCTPASPAKFFSSAAPDSQVDPPATIIRNPPRGDSQPADIALADIKRAIRTYTDECGPVAEEEQRHTEEIANVSAPSTPSGSSAPLRAAQSQFLEICDALMRLEGGLQIQVEDMVLILKRALECGSLPKKIGRDAKATIKFAESSIPAAQKTLMDTVSKLEKYLQIFVNRGGTSAAAGIMGTPKEAAGVGSPLVLRGTPTKFRNAHHAIMQRRGSLGEAHLHVTGVRQAVVMSEQSAMPKPHVDLRGPETPSPSSKPVAVFRRHQSRRMSSRTTKELFKEASSPPLSGEKRKPVDSDAVRSPLGDTQSPTKKRRVTNA